MGSKEGRAQATVRALRRTDEFREVPAEVWDKLRTALERGNVAAPESYLRKIIAMHERGTYEVVVVTPEYVLGAMWRTFVYEKDGCLLWKGMTNGDGYGVLRMDGKNLSAHRLAWERVTGPLPDGANVHHVCRVRHCVNPAHLVPVPTRGEHSRLHALENAVLKAYASGALLEEAQADDRPWSGWPGGTARVGIATTPSTN